MKQLLVQQIEIGLNDGAVRLVMFPMAEDGEIYNIPHLIGIMPDDDAEQILAEIKIHLTSKGYIWPEDNIFSRALKHRELILGDPIVQANVTADREARKQAEADQETQRQADEQAALASAAAADKQFNDAVDAAVAKGLKK